MSAVIASKAAPTTGLGIAHDLRKGPVPGSARDCVIPGRLDALE